MAEERAEGVPSVEPRCPWCSSLLPAADAAECPSCGAALLSDGDPQLPGLTTVTPPALIKSNQPRRPNRLLQWITGDEAGEQKTPAPPGSLAPPPAEVRREMLRLELEAQLADLTAEVGAMASEADLAAEAGDARDAEAGAAEAGTASPSAPPAPDAEPRPGDAEATPPANGPTEEP